MKSSQTLLGISALLLVSCSKSSFDYYQPQQGIAENFTNSCNGKGPDDHIRFTLHQNVYVEATAYFSQVEPGKFTAQISYFVPQENTLRFVDKSFVVSDAAQINKTFIADQVYRFMGTDHIERQSIEGLLPGRTIPIKYFQEIRDVDVGYRIEIKHQFANNVDQFTLKLPMVEINGQSVTAEPITFSLKELSRSLPGNCQLPQYQ
ncbi:hypothetical protein FE810_05425 [Thalassotalea litorea]|uniref:Uncharacterized protein n=1 Tax=Thalassotalea litorea TaxID=2020715 RepID=A0A5R9IS92_9GAMM|nr:hypothetical protein [Thalassotalea litorea]TLU66161.1 hypothetical protein FE810_05425 [Thalassotalea litorea]